VKEEMYPSSVKGEKTLGNNEMTLPDEMQEIFSIHVIWYQSGYVLKI